MSLRAWLAASSLVAGLAAFVAPAHAGDADCTYIEVAATNGKDASMDPKLKPIEKKLKKPPFTSWNTFKQLSSGTLSLTQQKAEALKLQQGAASLLLRGRTEKRIELGVTMDGADGKRVLDTKPAFKAGDYLVLVGMNVKDDGHILALTCK